MKLTKEDIGKKFNTSNGVITMISHHEYESLFSTGDTGGVVLLVNEDGEFETGSFEDYNIISRHEQVPVDLWS